MNLIGINILTIENQKGKNNNRDGDVFNILGRILIILKIEFPWTLKNHISAERAPLKYLLA